MDMDVFRDDRFLGSVRTGSAQDQKEELLGVGLAYLKQKIVHVMGVHLYQMGRKYVLHLKSVNVCPKRTYTGFRSQIPWWFSGKTKLCRLESPLPAIASWAPAKCSLGSINRLMQ